MLLLGTIKYNTLLADFTHTFTLNTAYFFNVDILSSRLDIIVPLGGEICDC